MGMVLATPSPLSGLCRCLRHCLRALALSVTLLGEGSVPAAPAFQGTENDRSLAPGEPLRLQRSLGVIRRLEDPAQRASLLLDLVEACAGDGCPEPPAQLLEEIEAALQPVEAPAAKVELLLRLSRQQRQLVLHESAAATLARALRLSQGIAGQEGAALLLRVSLAQAEAGDPEAAALLLAEGTRQLNAATAPAPSFPFAPSPPQVELGFALSGSSFRDAAGMASISLDLYQQGRRQDLDVELTAAAEYDSTRSYNTVRPNGVAVVVFRHHLDRRWNLFFDQLASVNNDTFSSRDDDEDLSLLSVSLAGIGMNLWRGETPSSFLEAQLGVGVRYEYEWIDFQQKLNQVDPNLAFVLRARELSLGAVRWNQILALGSVMNDWSNAFVWSTTSIKLPLGDRWWWNNEFVLRYRTEPVDADDPSVNALFSTGLIYKF